MHALGNDCSNIRLDAPPYFGDELSAQNQGSSGLCFAFTAAYLVDYMRMKKSNKKDNFRSSPLLLALDYKTNGFYIGKGNHVDGGIACPTILRTKKIYSNVLDHKLYDDVNYSTFLNQLQELYDDHSLRISKGEANDFFFEAPRFDDRTLVCGTKQVLSNFLGEIPLLFGDVLIAINQPTFPSFVDALFKKYKKENVSLRNTLSCEDYDFSPFLNSKKSLLRKINQSLNQKKPIGIGYCGNQLLREAESCGPHASPLIGRRFKQGKCEYLIQNSEGPACDVQIDYKYCKNQGRFYKVGDQCYEKLYAHECEAGKIWVNEKELLKSIYRVTVVK